ncbi:hypothetical protein [Nocardia brasiliensis]|uniref:hypothetical protein n=1 Tax=Nocardia brasiliensis TaxID=37326 RepID=UPI003D9289A8
MIHSIGFIRPFRGRLRDRPLVAVANAILDHGLQIVEDAREHGTVRQRLRLLAQTDRSNGGMNRIFEYGGSNTGIITGDGYPLYELEVEISADDRLDDMHQSLLERLRSSRSARDLGTDAWDTVPTAEECREIEVNPSS